MRNTYTPRHAYGRTSLHAAIVARVTPTARVISAAVAGALLAALLWVGLISADDAHATTSSTAAAAAPRIVKASGADSRGFVLWYSDGAIVMYPSLRVAQRECATGYATRAERNACWRYVTLRQYPWLNRVNARV
jgi:hypothetical protein